MSSKLNTPIASRIALASLAAVLLVLSGLALWAAVEGQRAREPLHRALRTTAHLKTVQGLSHLQAALDAYGARPDAAAVRRLRDTERDMLRALETLRRSGAFVPRELAADVRPRVESFRQKRQGMVEAVEGGRLRLADRIEDAELDPLLVAMQELIDRRMPDPTRRFRQDVARFERSADLVRDVVLVATPVGLVLLAFFGLLLRHQRRRELRRTRREAETDWLTGLANRRRLTQDLDAVALAGPSSGERVLLLYDLDGFKLYNDTFGHPAGDALLQRLAAKLEETVAPGRAYRVGGDEFCVLAEPGADGERLAAAGAEALSEQGEAFAVTSSWGMVAIPSECVDAAEAMLVADQRMYAQKADGRVSAGRQTRDVLLAALGQRQPQLREHVSQVATLAVAVGRQLGMAPAELEELACAAQLHDVGKVAIPDAILDNRGPLNEDEWAFMRRHTLIGERILQAAPAMTGVARLVRSSHERWDGGGYPDGLAGAEIPLGSRIVFVCDAFHAMSTTRVYSPGRPRQEVIAELERCAGTQFDPGVVSAFTQAIDDEQPPKASEPRIAAA